MSKSTRKLSIGGLLAAACLCGPAPAMAAPPPADLSGAWAITAKVVEGVISAPLDLKRDGAAYSGRSGALDNLTYCPLSYTGQTVGRRLHLAVQCMGRDVGAIDLDPQGAGLAGRGKLFNTDVEISLQRPVTPTAGSPRTFDYNPTQFHPITSAAPPPVLRIASGDTVRTRTVDAYGLDEHGASASMPGNPGTGPFYVEGALPGDTVAIHLISLKTNRPTARMNNMIDPAALMPGYIQSPGLVRDPTWLLDPAKGVAMLQTPSEKLKGFRTPLRPMLGVITVALPGGQSVANRELGEWGGNLDFPEIREGVTLYLPVYQAGALIFMGDAHARQADGEIAGQGLETSMDVEFRVTLIKNKAFPQPWAENADDILVSGIGGDLTEALRRATTGLSMWLKSNYGLDDSEVAAVLGSSIKYDIAEVVSAKSHVVAKIRKDVLSQIPRPSR